MGLSGDSQRLSERVNKRPLLLCCGAHESGSYVWFIFIMSQHPAEEAKTIAEPDSLGLSTTAERRHPGKMPYADLQCFSTNKDEATVTLCPESVHG